MKQVTFYTNDLITIQDAVELLGVTRMTIYRWIDDDKLTRYELAGSKRVFLLRSEVERIGNAKQTD